jgi:effector-binding domain-containing protein
VALYLDCSMSEMNVECGVEVPQEFDGNGRVVCSSTPAGTAATTTHIGPYHKLGEAWQAIDQWCKDNGHQLAGPGWEIYGHPSPDPTQQPRTDVYRLLKDSAT